MKGVESKVRRSSVLLVLFTALFVFPAHTQAQYRTPVNGEGHSSLAAIDQLVLAYLKDNKVPGVTVAVTIDGQLKYSKSFGYADADKKIAMLPTHRTMIGSVSKVVTTAAVMKLHEKSGNDFTVETPMYGPKGLFASYDYTQAIEERSRAVGPGASGVFEAWYRLTQIKHLLSHTAGWNGSGDREKTAKMFNVSGDKVTPNQNHLYFPRTQPLIGPPGSRFKYSNRSIGVMDHVIETVSGEGYVSFVKKNVFNPIDLTHVSVAVCASIRQNSGMKTLVVEIARLSGKASTPASYDLFK